jgi:ABC-type dipeptide/oligopeptide/nickel transport system permease component
MPLGFYLVKRVLYSVPLLLGAITVIFALIHAAPGDPTDYIIGDASVDQEFIDRLRREMGLDQPLFVQLAKYILQVFTGDFGFSFVRNAPVLELILDRLPATLLLMGSQYVIAVSRSASTSASPRRAGPIPPSTGASPSFHWLPLPSRCSGSARCSS